MSHEEIARTIANLTQMRAAEGRNRLRLDIAAQVAGAVYNGIDGEVSLGRAAETTATVSLMIADCLIEQASKPPKKWSKDDDFSGEG